MGRCAQHGILCRQGTLPEQSFTPRQLYYQNRYRKGALRRVVAQEHTGLLDNRAGEAGKRLCPSAACRRSQHPDLHQHPGDGHRHRRPVQHDALLDPAEYGQLSAADRPGGPGHGNGPDRVGRQPATPRPVLLRPPGRDAQGTVDPPGCWLDASAVLVRQYLAYCFDSATKAGELTEIPGNGRQLVEDMKRSRTGTSPA